MKDNKEVIHTKIWNEIPEENNPFVAKKCFCAGYDVYGDLLGKVSWAEYIFLLFKLEKPTEQQAKLLEAVAVAIANPGIRDHSVRASMNAGVGGSTSASALMAALAVGAGQYSGAREVFLFMKCWEDCKRDMKIWGERIKTPIIDDRADVWGPIEHSPGFDPNGVSCQTTTIQILDHLSEIAGSNTNLNWLVGSRNALEGFSNHPLSLTAVIATAFLDLTFNCDQAEMLFLLLRLPGAAAHALEQRQIGWRKFPFFGDSLKLENDPVLKKEM